MIEGHTNKKWRLAAIRALRNSVVVGQVMLSIYRIADIKFGLALTKQATS